MTEKLDPRWKAIREKLGYKETFIPSRDVDVYASGVSAVP
jgi:hypothetical protein